MKKHLLLLATIFTLLFSNVFSQTVHITKSGKKYHSGGCGYLKSDIPIELSEALARGLSPCSKCSPPNSVGTNQSSESSNQNSNSKPSNNVKPSNNANSTKVQCSATTKAGSQCNRMTNSPNGLCWQHGGK